MVPRLDPTATPYLPLFLPPREHKNFLISWISYLCMLSRRRKWQPTSVFLPGESQGRGSLVGCVYGVAQSQIRLKWLSSSSSSSSSMLFGLPWWLKVKNPSANAGNAGGVCSIPGSGRCPGLQNDNPLYYSCPENSMNREAWWAVVHGVAESDMTEWLSMRTCCLNILQKQGSIQSLWLSVEKISCY